MTYEDVATAADALRVQGVQPSGNSILRYLHGHGQKASKRTILKHLKAGAGQPALGAEPSQGEMSYGDALQEPPPAPVAITEPVALAPVIAVDPVVQAEQALTAAEAALVIARAHMGDQVMALFLMNGIVVEGVRYGGLHRDDPERQYLLAEAQQATGEYAAAWERVTQARQAHTKAVQAYRVAHQEAYVARTQSALPEAVHDWQERLLNAPSNSLHAEAKKNLQLAMDAWRRAVHAAPWDQDGVPLRNSHGRFARFLRGERADG